MVEGIRRFTTEYVMHEDRIRLSLETSGGQVRFLWLTRRLCTRLVPQISNILAQRPKIYEAAVRPPTDNAQRRSQMNALGKLEKQSPVRAMVDENVEEHLVPILSIRMTAASILLDFKATEDHLIQTIPFPEDALRQWLVMLKACFVKAEWTDDVWPDWIVMKGGEEGADPVRLN